MATVSLARKALFFLKDYWIIPVLIAVCFVGYFTFRKWRGKAGENILQPVLDKLRVIQAGSQVRDMQIQMGVEKATAAVKDKYKVQTLALENEQAAKVQELENDPVALARFLESITR